MVEPFLTDPDLTLYVGDALETLRELPDESVHCCVTSPPYWGLRDYGTGEWEGGDPECDHRHETKHQVQGATSARAGRSNVEDQRNENFRDECGKCGATRVDRQLGLEATPDEYVARMVEVFREVLRVLRSDGTCWLNLGDSYSGAGYSNHENTGGAQREDGGKQSHLLSSLTGLKSKDLVGIPWRVALALQADGWWLRSDIIWAKPNPMPESVTDRPTKAHEYVFLLTKSARYFYDADAIREDFSPDMVRRAEAGHTRGNGKRDPSRGDASTLVGGPVGPRRVPQVETLDGLPGESPRGPDGRRETAVKGAEGSIQHRDGERWPNEGRNARSVWTIGTQQFADAHFAVFPEELPRRCIAAGTSERGCCPECGAPWERETETERLNPSGVGSQHKQRAIGKADGNLGANGPTAVTVTAGWRPTCACAGVDLSPIMTPLGEAAGEDPTLQTGRKGLDRPRGAGEGTRPITRYEQQEYARQLRDSPARPQMEIEADAGAFAHYIRTDESGARPVPPDLLERWIGNGWLERVEIPELELLEPVPCTVLDPFMGSGTTALVARKLGRRCVGIELNPEYAELIVRRTQQLSLFADA